MIIRPLTGTTVLITRPSGDQHSLAIRIKAAGGQFIHLPTLAIDPIETKTAELSAFGLLVFISRNAVRHGLRACGGEPAIAAAQAQGLRLVAIGKSTAQELTEAGLRVDIQPKQGASSEALLQHPELQQLQDNVLIVRGEGGRELLRERLQQRGAQVQYLEVYRRRPLSYTLKVPAAQICSEIDMLATTSDTILRQCCNLLEAKNQARWASKQLVVASDRMVKTAKQLGFLKKPTVAVDATDDAMFAAILQAAR